MSCTFRLQKFENGENTMSIALPHIKFVSSKNIDNWPIYGLKSIKISAYAQIWYFAHYLANFYPILIKLCICAWETTSNK